jgi:hypothetical protein
MVSDPYLQEEYSKGISNAVFNKLETAAQTDRKEPKIGEMIAQSIMIPR